MKQNTIIVVVLVVLIIISVFQAFQLNDLKTKINEGGLITSSFTAPGDGGRVTASLPSNIQNLPQMVGGC